MSTRTVEQMRRDALAIWRAGVEAVRPERLVSAALRVDGETLWIGGEALPLAPIGRIAVIGGGKACGAMAAAVEGALGERVCREKQVAGWVNVPADCLPSAAAGETLGAYPASPHTGPLPEGEGVKGSALIRAIPRFIHLHAGRPAGVNEPCEEGVRGTAEILRLVGSLGPSDLCLCLIGGGGSALLTAPAEGVSLADKVALTRYLSAAGANIRQLNTVRKHLSRIKGGGLARACRAGRLIALIISDVIGDPLSVIASGPTVPDDTTPADALAVLEEFGARQAGIALAAIRYLEERAKNSPPFQGGAGGGSSSQFEAVRDFQGAPLTRPLPGGERSKQACRVTNLVIGKLATAVEAAGREAQRLGYSYTTVTATQLEGAAEAVGRNLAECAIQMRTAPGPDCLIGGGEPTVVLVNAARRGLGGRNQQLALAAGLRLAEAGAGGCLVLSGGTDGEDGPTDAAGAWVDAELMAEAARRGLDPADFLARNDAWHFFEPLGGLIRTGPTETNVGDLRVVLVDRTKNRAPA